MPPGWLRGISHLCFLAAQPPDCCEECRADPDTQNEMGYTEMHDDAHPLVSIVSTADPREPIVRLLKLAELNLPRKVTTALTRGHLLLRCSFPDRSLELWETLWRDGTGPRAPMPTFRTVASLLALVAAHLPWRMTAACRTCVPSEGDSHVRRCRPVPWDSSCLPLS